MAADSVEEILHVFHKRHDVLECICRGDLDKQEVVATIDVSRPTVDRAFRELEETGLLTSVGTDYELTNFGELCCEEFTRLRSDLDTMSELSDAMSHLPSELGLDREVLHGADVHYPERHAPQEPFREMGRVARTSGEVRGYAPIVIPLYVDTGYEILVEEAKPATIAFNESAVETCYESYEQFAAMLDADHATIYSTPAMHTIGVVCTDEAMGISVGNERPTLEAVITNDTDAALEWADEFMDEVLAPDDVRKL